MDKECSICLESYNINDTILILSCKHFYHKDCFNKCNNIKGKCFICRQNILFINDNIYNHDLDINSIYLSKFINEIKRYCVIGDLDKILFIINNSNVHINDDIFLQTAIKYGHLNIVKDLINKGANIYCNFEDNALILSIKYNHIDITKYLVEKCNIDIHINDNYAINYAIINDRNDIIKYFIEICKFDINSDINIFLTAIEFSKLDIIMYFITKCNVNIHNDILKRRIIYLINEQSQFNISEQVKEYINTKLKPKYFSLENISKLFFI